MYSSNSWRDGLPDLQRVFFPDTLHKRIDGTLALKESLVEDRTRLAMAGWRAFLDSPSIGVGLDNFRYIARQYMSSATDQVPHNLWIQLLSQVGLFGTLGFLFIIAHWYVVSIQAQSIATNASQRELLWALIASMSAIMTIYMFKTMMIQRPYWWVY
jgi:O-antigen ligase